MKARLTFELRGGQPKVTFRKRRAIVEVKQTLAVVPRYTGTAIQHVTLQLERVNCGKPRCKKCRRGASHGPYWYAYYWRRRSMLAAPKLVSRYLGKEPDTKKLSTPTKSARRPKRPMSKARARRSRAGK
jgi:hypothetical protein